MASERLRRPCEHGRYDEHGGFFDPPPCPGGEFLADDALVPIDWCDQHGSLILGRTYHTDEPYCLVWTQAYSESMNPKEHPSDCREVEAFLIFDALTVREGAE